MSIIFGRNPVIEALKSDRQIEKLVVINNGEGSIKRIEKMARDSKIPIQYVDKKALDRFAGSTKHQGVAAQTSPYKYYEVEDILAKASDKGEEPFLVILDSVEDPHNLGAIIRTADGAGAHGVIIPKRKAVGLTETVGKASAGAVEYMPVAKVTNIANTIDELKQLGIWIAACDMDGELYYKVDLTGPIAVIIGSEGKGISRLVREKSDFVVSLPMKGKISSLNASNAAAVLMYEINRQRSCK
ncbi:MAG: 23S rRNA (guanosine(2251)-2'-O)-methyltransferase RlmB [Clostridiales bacterium]|nr:23S rRNA (guanosine(2251)-2'-O)-methyltransferase RlmB [Clostridiales bacterium]